MGEVLQFPTPPRISELETIFQQILRAERQKHETSNQRVHINAQRQQIRERILEKGAEQE